MSVTYSKKTMEHFLNPKNMGEIKDADGVGKVGNKICGDVMWIYIKVGEKNVSGKKEEIIKEIKFRTLGCLPHEEKVSIGNDWISISDISKGNAVLNSEGKRATVKDTYKTDFDGKLIHIIPFVSKFNSFSVTPTHPIFCIKRKFLKYHRISNKNCNWLRINENELVSTNPHYIEAAYLEKGDYLIFPKRKEVKDNPTFTKNTMKLFGYYLSEGYVTSDGRVINFAFNKNEKEEINEVKKILKKEIGNSGSERTRGNVTEMRVCSSKLARFIVSVAGKYAKKKNLSEEVMLLPFEKQWEMIKTYIKGDGNTYARREKESVTYRMDTASEKLAIQIQEMLARGNIFAPIKKFIRPPTFIEGRKLKAHTLYNISFKLERKHKFVKENKKYFFVPIKKIGAKSFKGKVYNLEMNGKNHSYLVKGFAVHNCAAAIATSSMITELAKGKTFSEALKITRDDVKDALGNLPPVKLHCSNLAADGLYEAIYDYLSKSGKPVPKALEEHHEKIKRMSEHEH